MALSEAFAPRDRAVLEAPPTKAKPTGQDLLRAGGETPSQFKTLIEQLSGDLGDKQPGQLVNEMKTSGKLTPLHNNAIVGVAEAGGDRARLAQLAEHADNLARETPGRPAADVMADAVEMMRAGEAPAAKPAARSPTSDLATQIAEANPDMPFRLDEGGKSASAREELEAIRKEAAEGTDTELGANDASLLQVAVNCLISTGGF